MREARLMKQVGTLALGAGLVFGLALPAAAQETAVATNPEGTLEAVADSTQSFVAEIVEVDPQVAFTDAFLTSVNETGDIGDVVEEVLEDLGLEDQELGETVDNTPLNPVDEGSLETPDDVDLGALPEV